MKHVSKTLRKDYSAVRLFLEDLEGIEALIGNSSNFKIKSDDFEFASVAELRSKHGGEELAKLELVTYTPTLIQLELRRWSVSLYCGSDDIESAGLFYKLDKIVTSAQLKPKFLYSWYTIYAVNFLLLAIPYTILESFAMTIDRPVRIVAALSLLVWIIVVGYVRTLKNAEVTVAYRKDMPGFFSRNKDQILVAGISALIGSVATLILTPFLEF